jgi:O-antigen ligase
MAGTTLLGIYLGYALAPQSIARVLTISLIILITSSIAVSLAVPDYGIADGAWKGVTGNRNSLAMMAALAMVFFLVQLLYGRIDWRYGLAFAGSSLFVVMMTGSATSTVAVAVGSLVVVLFQFSKELHLRPRMLAAVLLLAVALGAIGLVLAVRAQHDVMASGVPLYALEQVTSSLARDVTLTGRTRLWDGSLKIIAERPWIGYGFDIVWGFGDRTYLPHVAATAAPVSNAHNGFLDVATQIGLPAALTAVLMVVRAWFVAASAFQRERSWFELLAIGFLFTFMVINVSEAILFVARDTPWMLFVAMTVGLERRHPSRRRRALRRRRNRRPARARPAARAVADAPITATSRARS